MLVDKLKEGDVIYSSCDGHDLCYHLGIVYSKGDKKYVFHNAPTQINKYGGTIISEKAEAYLKNREVYRIVSTRVSNEKILQATKYNRTQVWDSLLFNCEDFISEIVEGERNSDIRDAWTIVAIGAAIMIMI